jgi:hypothetical protein
VRSFALRRAESLGDAKVFSVALDRTTFVQQKNLNNLPAHGFLAFGGMVPVAVTGKTATSPVLMFTNEASGRRVDAFYAVTIDSFIFPGSANVSSQSFAILDTGTSLTLLPTPVRPPPLRLCVLRRSISTAEEHAN